jgi:hypothetical protein
VEQPHRLGLWVRRRRIPARVRPSSSSQGIFPLKSFSSSLLSIDRRGAVCEWRYSVRSSDSSSLAGAGCEVTR